jgi:hypothetical protein
VALDGKSEASIGRGSSKGLSRAAVASVIWVAENDAALLRLTQLIGPCSETISANKIDQLIEISAVYQC